VQLHQFIYVNNFILVPGTFQMQLLVGKMQNAKKKKKFKAIPVTGRGRL
jgi:hypothetical protein